MSGDEIEEVIEEENTPLFSGFQPHSFLDTPIGSFKGPNSLHRFADSFTRAQSFAASKIDNRIKQKRSFFVGNVPSNESAVDDELVDPDLMVPASRGERLSSVIYDPQNRSQIFGRPDRSMAGMYNDDYGSVFSPPSRSNSVFEHRSRGRKDDALSFSSHKSMFSIAASQQGISLKQIEDKEGNVVTVLAGQSTAPQTVFNSVNVLIGVGLLALPVGILKAGWILGVLMLVACGSVTYWSATLLSKAMDTDNTIMTYADLGYAAYGSLAKLFIMCIFSIDLIGAGVSLIVLLSDSVYALLGDAYTKNQIKFFSFFVLLPFSFLPLRILSFFSLLGIISTVSITMLVFVCGFLRTDLPGSLITRMPTNVWPLSLPDLLLAIGILMAPFGGHAIFPNLKSDMRHPYRFTETLKATYSITLTTDISMGVVGFLMFGKLCDNEITNNILSTKGYPSWCYPLLCMLICIIPLAKVPLNSKPIISTLSSILSLDKPSAGPIGSFFKSATQSFIKIAVNALFVILAIQFPDFDRVVGILGAAICFLVCIILPCAFYLKLVRNIRLFEKLILIAAIVLSSVLAVVGTWAVIHF